MMGGSARSLRAALRMVFNCTLSAVKEVRESNPYATCLHVHSYLPVFAVPEQGTVTVYASAFRM